MISNRASPAGGKTWTSLLQTEAKSSARAKTKVFYERNASISRRENWLRLAGLRAFLLFVFERNSRRDLPLHGSARWYGGTVFCHDERLYIEVTVCPNLDLEVGRPVRRYAVWVAERLMKRIFDEFDLV